MFVEAAALTPLCDNGQVVLGHVAHEEQDVHVPGLPEGGAPREISACIQKPFEFFKMHSWLNGLQLWNPGSMCESSLGLQIIKIYHSCLLKKIFQLFFCFLVTIIPFSYLKSMFKKRMAENPNGLTPVSKSHFQVIMEDIGMTDIALEGGKKSQL